MNIPRVPPFCPSVESAKINFCTETGAKKLGAIIDAAWAKCGYTDVKITIARRPGRAGRDNEFDVRTNLVNGIPLSAWRTR